MLEPNLAGRTKREVSSCHASAATGLSLTFWLSQWFSKLWTERVHQPSRQQQGWMRGKPVPRACACTGRCLPEVVKGHEQIWVFQCNFSGNFIQCGSTGSAPRDDTFRILTEGKIYLHLLCSLVYHSGFRPLAGLSQCCLVHTLQQLRIYPTAFRDYWDFSFLHPHPSDPFSRFQENLIDSS